MLLHTLVHSINGFILSSLSLLEAKFKHFKGLSYPSVVEVFSKGDIMELSTGEQGRVLMVGRNKVTNEVEAYIVSWKFTYKGNKFSLVNAREKGLKKIS
jgi:hypothetical protein